MPLHLDDARAILARTPLVLQQLLGGLPDSLARSDEGPGTWSPAAVATHLLCTERTHWIPRLRVFLADGSAAPRTLPRLDQREQLLAFGPIVLPEVLTAFERERQDSLGELASRSLGEADLLRTAEHPDLGIVTLGMLLATWVAHDLSHLAQISRTMAGQYREAVGPWAAYLRVLHR